MKLPCRNRDSRASGAGCHGSNRARVTGQDTLCPPDRHAATSASFTTCQASAHSRACANTNYFAAGSRGSEYGRTMLTLMMCLALLAAVRMLTLRHALSGFELIRSSGSGRLRLELCRRALVCRAEGDTHEFPQPREVRVLVVRVAGVALFSRSRVIGLPQHVEGCIHQLRAEDFDAHFSGCFRLAGESDNSDGNVLNLLWRA